jgi:hypothetical protein
MEVIKSELIRFHLPGVGVGIWRCFSVFVLPKLSVMRNGSLLRFHGEATKAGLKREQ